MEYAIVAVPAAPVRRKPVHSREMTNQLLFGENVALLKKRGKWIKVRSLHDHYEGWMTFSLLLPAGKPAAESPAVTSDLLAPLQWGERKLNIPAASSLPGFQDGKGMMGDTAYTFNGHYFTGNNTRAPVSHIEQLSTAWLNAPYLWGGRTPLGVDCSGFVQVIFKQLGISLPRDAWQQAQEGGAVKKISQSLPGDLAFFDDKDEIVHTGILLGEDRIIHASGMVRIDQITKKGITGPDGKTTYRLRAIRRCLQLS